jgi:hypothetical protein
MLEFLDYLTTILFGDKVEGWTNEELLPPLN